MIGIAVDSARNVADFAQKTEVAYPLLIAGAAGSELARELGNSALALPYTLIVDRSGAIRNVHLGRFSEARLERRCCSPGWPRSSGSKRGSWTTCADMRQT